MPKVAPASRFSLAIEYYREKDGRWLADIAALPGVTAYGRTKRQATAAVQALARRLIADRLEHGEALPGPMSVSFVAAGGPATQRKMIAPPSPRRGFPAAADCDIEQRTSHSYE